MCGLKWFVLTVVVQLSNPVQIIFCGLFIIHPLSFKHKIQGWISFFRL